MNRNATMPDDPAVPIALADTIGNKHFVGKHDAVIGACLAELVSRFLSQFPPDLAAELLAEHVSFVNDLMPANRALLIAKREGTHNGHH